MSSPYRVETNAVDVEVSLGSGRRLSGEIFLHGGETPIDFMNDSRAFFPMRVQSPEPATILVAKAHVHYLTVPPMENEPKSAVSRSIATRLEVSIELDDREVLSGVIYADLLPGRQRTLDFVNAGGVPFIVLVQPERDCIVRRSRIQLVCDADPQLD